MVQNASRANRIDRIDMNILATLFGQARVSKVGMSANVGVSASRCYQRMQRLEQAEIIRGYHADIDIPRLTGCLQFMVQVKLLNYTALRGKQFEKTLLKVPEVVTCQSVLGTIDYIMVIVAATVERYQEVINELRALSECEFDFVTFPMSRSIKSVAHGDLRQIVARIAREEADSSD